MPISGEPARDVVLQPIVATHVSRQELRTRRAAASPTSNRDAAHVLRPTLAILAATCALAVVVLLVVNRRLGTVGDATGSIPRVTAARDLFDHWVRPMFIVVAVAATILTTIWVAQDDRRCGPTLRRTVIVGCVIGFVACTVVGAIIGGQTLPAARAANGWAIASYGLLGAACIALWIEVGDSTDHPKASNRDMVPEEAPGYLLLP